MTAPCCRFLLEMTALSECYRLEMTALSECYRLEMTALSECYRLEMTALSECYRRHPQREARRGSPANYADPGRGAG